MTDDESTGSGGSDGASEPGGLLPTGRRRFVQGSLAAVVAGALSSGAGAESSQPVAGADDWQALMDGLPTNWGRWGPDDELGAINELGAEEMFEGMKAATKRGKKGVERFALQVPMTGVIDRDGATPGDPTAGDPVASSRIPAPRDNTGPTSPGDITDGLNGADDKFVTDLYLQGTTHQDSLGHVWVGHQIWNGFDADTTVTPESFTGDYDGDGVDETIDTVGLSKADVANAGSVGVVGRGVLLDVARHVNGDDMPLPLGYCIDRDLLQATAKAQKVELREHDILLVRTGALKRYYDPAHDWNVNIEPGLCFSVELVEWIDEMTFPVLGADNIAVEKLVQTIESPADGEDKTFPVPLHPAMLQRLGVSLHEIVWLEDLAAACADDGIYDFLFAGAPLNVERGTGAPMNSLAIKATGGGRGDSGRRDDENRGDGRRGDD